MAAKNYEHTIREAKVRLRQLVATSPETHQAATLFGAVIGYEMIQLAKMAMNHDEQEALVRASDRVALVMADLLDTEFQFSERT